MTKLYNVKVNNETECALVQRILFAKGFQWGGSGILLAHMDANYISVWDTFNLGWSCDVARGPQLTFDEFLDKMEEEL